MTPTGFDVAIQVFDDTRQRQRKSRAATDGHPVVSGLVELLYARDMSVSQRAHVDEERNIPDQLRHECDYLLKIAGGSAG